MRKKMTFTVIVATLVLMMASTANANANQKKAEIEAAGLQQNGKVYIATEGSYIDCYNLLWVSQGSQIAGNWEMEPTGFKINANGSILLATGEEDEKGVPLYKDSLFDLDLNSVVVQQQCGKEGEEETNNDATAAFASMTMTIFGGETLNITDTDHRSMIKAVIRKNGAHILAMVDGKTDMSGEVSQRFKNIVASGNVHSRAEKIIVAAGLLADMNANQIAELVRLQRHSEIERHNTMSEQALDDGYVFGTTGNQFLTKNKAKKDVEFVGDVYFEFNATTDDISMEPNGFAVNPQFKVKFKSNGGQLFLETRTTDNKTVYGLVYGDWDADGNIFSGTAWMSEMSNILAPTVTVQQAATYNFKPYRTEPGKARVEGAGALKKSRPSPLK